MIDSSQKHVLWVQCLDKVFYGSTRASADRQAMKAWREYMARKAK